jgi:hypothetical protein
MSIVFPDVPDFAGVPAVRRITDAIAGSQMPLSSVDDAAAANSTDWGIYDKSGSPVLKPDSIVSIERGAEYRISDYPVEQGGFASYNKVATPFEVRLTLTKGGSVAERSDFLNTLATLEASLDLYDVATPEHVYVGVNITRVSQSRSAQSGAGMAVVEILLQEVRETVSVAYTTATTDTPPPLDAAPAAQTVAKLTPKTVKSPSAAKSISQGNVQAKPVAISGAKLVTSSSGRQLYVYDKSVGKVH